jgi:hypothetical protein
VKTTTLAILGVLLLGTAAQAHGEAGWPGGFGGFGFLGGGFGDRHFGFGGFDGFGGFAGDFGLGFFNADNIQTRFENRFDSLKTQYDDGVAGGTDFFTSTTYDNIVNKTQSLSDRYDFFVSGVDHSITRLGDFISTANDDVTFYNDLLANYQADTSISAARLDRIELWINHITDRLNTKIDTLTQQQTTLQTNLPTYQMFQTDLSTFLSDIEAAGGGGSSGSSSSLTSLASSALTTSVTQSSGSLSPSSSLALSSTAVPEPSIAALMLLASAVIAAVRGRPRSL